MYTKYFSQWSVNNFHNADKIRWRVKLPPNHQVQETTANGSIQEMSRLACSIKPSQTNYYLLDVPKESITPRSYFPLNSGGTEWTVTAIKRGTANVDWEGGTSICHDWPKYFRYEVYQSVSVAGLQGLGMLTEKSSAAKADMYNWKVIDANLCQAPPCWKDAEVKLKSTI